MSAPPPGDRDPDPTAADPTAPGDAGGRSRDPGTYDFHGEKLDFDPYRFGAPEPTAPTWDPPQPGSSDGAPPSPGDRWSPGGDGPEVRPGDYWQGNGSAPRPGDVFPPAGWTPPHERGGPGVDLHKPDAPAGHAPPASYPPPSGYDPYGAPGSYPHAPRQRPGGRGGNGLAVAGMVLGILGIVLALTSWPGILVGAVGLGLSIGGLVRARRGAPMKGIAIAGLVCSAIAVVASVIVLVVVLSRIDFTCVRDAGGNFGQAQECVK